MMSKICRINSTIFMLVFMALCYGLFAGTDGSESPEISRAFELRFVTADPEADGETDFKGETEVFDLDHRIEYLRNWASYGRRFFKDPELNRPVVHDKEVESVLENLKPQPLPQIRRKIRLEDWKFLGYREGQRQEELQQLQQWSKMEGVTIKDGRLFLSGNTFDISFPDQPWRTKLSWKAMVPGTPERVTFRLSDYVAAGFAENGRFFYVVDGVEIPAGSYTPGEFYHFEVELDPDGGLTPDYSRNDVKASSEIAIDPETHSYHKRHQPAVYAAHGWNFWSSADNTYPQWISFRLEDRRRLTAARLAFRRDNDRTYNFRLEASEDNENWVQLTDEMTSSADRWTKVDIDNPTEALYVRVVFTGASSPGFSAAMSMVEFFDEDGRVFLADDKPVQGKFNFSVNGQLLADYVSFSGKPASPYSASVNSFRVETGGGVVLDQIWGVGYDNVTGHDVRHHPFTIGTFINTDFRARPDPEGFQNTGYDDSGWEVVPYRRYAHGGERRKEEALYLRRLVRVEAFDRAVLNIETARPSADIYVNGVHIGQAGRYPWKTDITDILVPERDNIVAVRVDPYRVEQVQYHMSTDPWTGWYAGLMDIELTGRVFVEDVFAYAEDVDDPALLRVHVNTVSELDESFRGRIITRVYPWYPEESGIMAGESSKPVYIDAGGRVQIEEEVSIPSPALWSVNTPNLYKVEVRLQDDEGNFVDDFVLTTGLRTVSQDSGTFRINGRPEMLNGPLIFGHHYPLERISQWMFSPPKSRWVHDILLTRKMNGTAFRMSVHDRRVAGINDRRLAQIGDQMGIMFIWQTPAWVRAGSVDGFDFEGVPKYVREVRNNPSIVMWQPGNHPSPHYSMEWFQAVHDAFAAVDRTRLISPSGDMSRMQGEFKNRIGDTWRPADDDTTYPAWTSPLIARGTMEQVLAYGQDWQHLRNFPGMHGYRGMELEVRTEYLNSKTHAWFDFESEETIGQANWNLTRGKPWHRMYSYEINYDVGSIGRKLDFEEWRESQAWHALSAYEAYRKKRWLGFDGMNWCPLRGGGNTATYMKPLLDYQNHPKLAYYAVQMVFQPVLAGSRNVGIVYGPNDEIPVMVMNLGRDRIVDVTVLAKNMEGVTVAQTVYKGVKLPDGKGVIDLGMWMPDLIPEKYYAFEYIVMCAE